MLSVRIIGGGGAGRFSAASALELVTGDGCDGRLLSFSVMFCFDRLPTSGEPELVSVFLGHAPQV